MQPYTAVISDPQAKANEVFVEFDHPTHGPVQLISSPMNMSKTPARQAAPAPRLGEHTDEVLLEYGYDRQEVESLRQRGVIA